MKEALELADESKCIRVKHITDCDPSQHCVASTAPWTHPNLVCMNESTILPGNTTTTIDPNYILIEIIDAAKQFGSAESRTIMQTYSFAITKKIWYVWCSTALRHLSVGILNQHRYQYKWIRKKRKKKNRDNITFQFGLVAQNQAPASEPQRAQG